MDQYGSISALSIASVGGGYAPGDVILASAPVQFEVGKPISLRAKINDPINELDRVVFLANGAEIPGQQQRFGDEVVLTFIPQSEALNFYRLRHMVLREEIRS